MVIIKYWSFYIFILFNEVIFISRWNFPQYLIHQDVHLDTGLCEFETDNICHYFETRHSLRFHYLFIIGNVSNQAV